MSLIGMGSVRNLIIPKRANNPIATPVLNLNALSAKQRKNTTVAIKI